MTTTEEWQRLVSILENIKDQFYTENKKYKTSSNKKNQAEAYRQLSILMDLAKYHVWQNHEALEILWGENEDGMYRATVRDEFLNDIYFERLITKLIADIKSEKLS